MSANKLKPVGLPKRSGVRPKTILGPLHLQYSGHGDPKYLHQLIKDVLAWPDIDVDSLSNEPANLVSFRLKENAVTDESSAFLSPREFVRVHLSAPTIILASMLNLCHAPSPPRPCLRNLLEGVAADAKYAQQPIMFWSLALPEFRGRGRRRGRERKLPLQPQQPATGRFGNGFRTAGYIHLGKDRFTVRLHGSFADKKGRPDLFVTFSPGHKL